MDTTAMLSTTGAIIAAALIPFLTAAVKRLPWPWLAGMGAPLNAALAVVAYLVGWALDGAPREELGHYLIVALAAAGLGTAGHGALVHGPAVQAGEQ